MGIREVFFGEFQAMSKGSNSVFNGKSLSEGCKNYENWSKQAFFCPILSSILRVLFS